MREHYAASVWTAAVFQLHFISIDTTMGRRPEEISELHILENKEQCLLIETLKVLSTC